LVGVERGSLERFIKHRCVHHRLGDFARKTFGSCKYHVHNRTGSRATGNGTRTLRLICALRVKSGTRLPGQADCRATVRC
jgi:hypothetical protein